jgi:hypothetical protein
LKKARGIFSNAKEWSGVEDFLLITYRICPTVLPVVVEILVNRNHAQQDVSLPKIGFFIRSNIRRLIDNDKYGELSWILFLAKALKISLKARDVEEITQSTSAVCALILCDLAATGLIEGKISKQVWNQYLNAEGLKSEMWLYAYEATLKKWTGAASKNFIKDDKYFGELFSRGVSFYDENRNIERLNNKLQRERRSNLKHLLAFSRPIEEVDFDMIGEVHEDSLVDFEDSVYE